MVEVGIVGELWRYPVKSMEGNQLNESRIETSGMLGDRNWIIKDETSGELSTVRKLPKLLKFKARYDQGPRAGQVAPVKIELPDGHTVDSDSMHVNSILSEALGRSVSLWPLQPKTNLKHYLLKVPAGETAMKKQFATKKMPDMSSVTWGMMMQLAMFVTPLGRYQDVFPIHLLTNSSLARLKELEPEGDFRVERFRPNILIDTFSDIAAFEEFQWVDGTLYIGDVILKVVSRTVRCSMPSQPQASFGKDAKVLRALGAHSERHLGVNISVLKAGTIRVGDKVLFEASTRSGLARRADVLSSQIRNKAIQGSFKLMDLFTKR